MKSSKLVLNLTRKRIAPVSRMVMSLVSGISELPGGSFDSHQILNTISTFLPSSFSSLPSISLASESFTDILQNVNAWSVNGKTINSSDLTSNLFAVSLVPYLIFLYFISRPQTKTPQLSIIGFFFLLVFVGATIPAGIIAKTQYHDILANVDWLHFAAESLLTITNLLIIQGFRSKRPKNDKMKIAETIPLYDFGLLIASLLAFVGLFPHSEPSNALSLQTWAIHTSSIIEWLMAMNLVWEHAIVSNNPKWKWLSWLMLPSNVSGLCACTYHFYYNSPDLSFLVVLQSLFTVIGNSTLALGAYLVHEYEKISTSTTPTPILDDSKIVLEVENNFNFLVGTVLKSLLFAIFIKYGELFIDIPFQPSLETAVGIIFTFNIFVALKQGLRHVKSPVY